VKGDGTCSGANRDYWKSYVLDNYSFAEFPPGALVLDIGCGDGRQLKELDRRGYRAVGIEPNCDRVTSCRSQTLRVIQACGEQIPLKNASCDGLICKVVIPYTNEACVLGEIGRLLKPDAVGHLLYVGAGYYLRYLLCASSWKYRLYGLRTLLNTWLFATTGRRLPSFLGDTTYQSRARLRRYYSECGLKLLEERPAPTFLRISVFIYHSIQKTPD
jgi:SAM-dependent methyltransferase